MNIGVRWTIGDVSPRGWEELRLSVWGAQRAFDEARYLVCVNALSLEEARERVGKVPENLEWRNASDDVPLFVRERFDANMAEGVGWKLAPLRVFPDLYELSLDNDCILWAMPPTLRDWLNARDGSCLMAQDVKACFGAFEALCPPQARNAGIRGLPPNFDLEAALREVLSRVNGIFASETDEQGLQTAALSLHQPTRAVTLEEVSICSPFWPHDPELGACGAHFVGSNARHIPWNYYDRPADDLMREHWARHRETVYARLGLKAE